MSSHAALTVRQVHVLRVIRQQECPTIRVISEASGVSRSTAQAAAMGLLRKGLVGQGPSGFGPGATFHLTDAGRELLRHLDTLESRPRE